MGLPILFDMIAGDDYALSFSFKTPDEVPVDLTDVLFQATFKECLDDLDEDAPIVLDVYTQFPTIGVALLHFTHVQTSVLYPRRYFFDVQIVKDGVVTTILSGLVNVKAGVTQRGVPE